MAGGMVPAVVVIIRAITAQTGHQGFPVDPNVTISLSSAGQLNARHLAHNVHHVKRTFGLFRVVVVGNRTALEWDFGKEIITRIHWKTEEARNKNS